MTNRCVSYICMRPDHHRHLTADLRFTTYRDRRAVCPAAAGEGHEWFAVPDLSLDVLAAFGWIPSDVAEHADEATTGSSELATAAAEGVHA